MTEPRTKLAEDAGAEAALSSKATHRTSLGPTCERVTDGWRLDLTELPLFHGLSVLSRALGEMVIEQAQSERIDIDVQRAIRPRENPELREHLGVEVVKLAGEHPVLAKLVHDGDAFQDRLRALFGTLQRPRYRNTLFSPSAADAKSLLFRFAFPTPRGDRPAVFLLERVPSARREEACYLRINVEDPDKPRLDLDALPHVEVEDLERRTFIAGSTRIAQTWADSLRREAERGRRVSSEAKRPHSHLFRQFAKAGLGAIEQVTIHWTETLVDCLLDGDPAELSHVLKRVLLALEDRFVRRIIDAGETLEVVCNEVSIFVDQSQLGRVLALSLGARRLRLGLGSYLARMPALSRVVDGAADRRPLAGVKVVLVHHITSEVLGVIAGLRRLGCTDLTTVFVAYAGEPPSDYLDALLELPPEESRCSALVSVPDPERVEGRYKLSHRYSSLDNEASLVEMLGQKHFRFFEAMKALTVSEFLRAFAGAEAAGERCLIIEDGGYLGPVINDACARGLSVGALIDETDATPPADHDIATDAPLAGWLGARLMGSIEHTRNGFDRLAQVEAVHGGLAFPAFTIAVSRHKIDVEAREVAISILNAVENALNATGRILSRRNTLVLGSRGAIGGHLVRSLNERLVAPDAQIFGVDLKVEDETRPDGDTHEESFAVDRLAAAARAGVDLVLGVTGVSVLSGAEIEAWLTTGTRDEMVLASGSTKTAEFTGLAEWLDRLLDVENPTIGGHPARIVASEVKDPLTGRIYGHRYTFDLECSPDERRRRTVTFLANMMPVNFMFYGVATEVIDEVLAELIGCSLGLVDRVDAGEDLPRTIQVVDRDITPSGEPR